MRFALAQIKSVNSCNMCLSYPLKLRHVLCLGSPVEARASNTRQERPDSRLLGEYSYTTKLGKGRAAGRAHHCRQHLTLCGSHHYPGTRR